MSILREILDLLRLPNPNAPYYEGHPDYWYARTASYAFSGGSVFPLLIKYKMEVAMRRVDNEEFNKALMLEDGAVLGLLCKFRDSFLRWMSETNRHFNISEWDGRGRIIEVTPTGIKRDGMDSSSTLVKSWAQPRFVANGCEVELMKLEVFLDSGNENNIWGNYSMVAKTKTLTPDEALAVHKAEELAILVYLKERLSLLNSIQSERKYKEKAVTVQTQIISDSAAKISWTFPEQTSDGASRLQVFRKEGGYASTDDAASQGTLVIDSRRNGSQIEGLVGRSYFYTCYVTGSSGTQDFFRFELSVPPSASNAQLISKLTEMVTKFGPAETPISDPKRERLNRAFEELTEFVEFDENLTRWEKELITQIESKDYSAQEREEKIERLKLAVESIRVERL